MSMPNPPGATLGDGWTWTAGARTDMPRGLQWKHDENEGWKTFDPSASGPDAYALMVSAVVPRPIAFVSTLSETGVANLAPFSYFSMVHFYPPLLSICVAKSRASPTEKDTAVNIRATKEFVVNIISEPFVEAANATSIDAPHEKGEWSFSGLTQELSLTVKPARVRESAISFECEVYSIQDITLPNTDTLTGALILGLIKKMHVRRSVLAEDGYTIDPERLNPVCRLGGIKYATLGKIIELRRPVWSEYATEIDKAVSPNEQS